MRFVSSVLVLCTIISYVSCDPLWKVFCQGTPLFRGLADPIVNPGGFAQHSHKVFGGSNFDLGNPNTSPRAYYDYVNSSACTTCSITIDNSVYWVPDLYYRWDNGSISLVPDGGLTIYYPSRSGSGAQQHPNYTAIPPGLRIVAGSTTRRHYDPTDVTHKAVSYACLSTPGGPETGEFPTVNRFCKNGLRAQVWFPMCWDGVNLDSKNHFDHMSYPIDGRPDGGNCPSTHPVRLPGIFFELLFSVDKFPHGDGVSRFLWSNGDVTGNGLHGDFLNGWDPTIMQAALQDPSCDISNTCIGNCPEKCAPFTPYVKKDNPDQSCQIAKPIKTTEDLGVNHMISHLPGCNPITGESQNPTTPCTGSWPQPSGFSNNTRVAIRASNGLYLSVNNNQVPWTAFRPASSLSYYEMFELVPQGAGLYGIQSEITNQFCADNQRGATPLRFNRGSPSTWEFFSVNYTNGATGPTANGSPAFLVAQSNGNYLTLVSDGTVYTNATTLSAATTFYIVDPNAGVTDTRTSTAGFDTPAPPLTSETQAGCGGGGYDSSDSNSSPSPCPSPSPSSSAPTPTSKPGSPTTSPTSSAPTSSAPTSSAPTPTSKPGSPTTSPTSSAPTSSAPTSAPTSSAPTSAPTSSAPSSAPTASGNFTQPTAKAGNGTINIPERISSAVRHDVAIYAFCFLAAVLML